MKKRFIIFFLALIPIYFVYKIAVKDEYLYLAIGDDLAKGHTPFNTYNNSYTDYLYNYLKQNNESTDFDKSFVYEDIRINDMISVVKNTNNDSNNLQQLLKKADLITISIGSEELFSKIRSEYSTPVNKKYIDEIINNIEILIKEIRLYTKSPIYFIGYYSPLNNNNQEIDELFYYINNKFTNLENKYLIYYIDIYDDFKDNIFYLPNINNSFPTEEGYKLISNKIINKIKKI